MFELEPILESVVDYCQTLLPTLTEWAEDPVITVDNSSSDSESSSSESDWSQEHSKMASKEATTNQQEKIRRSPRIHSFPSSGTSQESNSKDTSAPPRNGTLNVKKKRKIAQNKPSPLSSWQQAVPSNQIKPSELSKEFSPPDNQVTGQHAIEREAVSDSVPPTKKRKISRSK